MRHKRAHLLVLTSYLLLAILLLYPTPLHFSTRLPGDGGDDPAIAWNLWWVKHALLNLGQNPLHCDYMFYPIGINLAFYTLTVLNALISLPLLLNFGVVSASNAHLVFTFVCGGYGAFLLSLHALKRDDGGALAGAAVAGGVYAFASSKLFFAALGQFNIASSHWIPYAALFTLKIGASETPRRNMRHAAMAALFLAMQTWSEMTYTSFLLIFIALYAVFAVVGGMLRREMPRQLPLLAAFALMGVLLAVGISPLLWAMIPDMAREGDFFVEGGGFADVFSSDVAGFFVPTMHHPILGGIVGGFSHDKGQHFYPGYSLLLLAALGIRARRKEAAAWFWGASALLFTLLALGPTIRVGGVDTHIPGPFVLTQYLPFFKGNRYPGRYGVMVLLSLSVLAAFGFAAMVRSRPRHRWAAAALAALLCFEHVSIPLPTSDMRVPGEYGIIAADPREFAVLEIPLAWRNGFRITGPPDPGFMFGQFYQTAHNRPILGGNTSRNPEFKFRYFTEAPVIRSLLALETGHALPGGRAEADGQIAADVLRFFGVGYVVVRPADSDNPAVTPSAAIPYIEAALPVEKVSESPSLTLYRVSLPPPAGGAELSASSPLARLYFAEGWGELTSAGVWAQRREARLFVPLGGGEKTLVVKMGGHVCEGQTMRAKINGAPTGKVAVSAGGEHALELPPGSVKSGLNEVTLEFSTLCAPPPDPDGPRITVMSAGEETGDFAHIYVDGVDVSPNGRGYNVAIIGAGGGLYAADSFDTMAGTAESGRLAEFIAGAPRGATIAVAAADTVDLPPELGGPVLQESAVDALRSIGAEMDMRGCFRCSHALVAHGGRVLESGHDFDPAVISTTGGGLTAAQVAAEVLYVRFR